MYQMCPNCLKSGNKNKIKLFQINLREAVWLCESADCIWPFSSSNLEYIIREVGQKWSYDWETYQLAPVKAKEAISQELFLYTPPDTPVTDHTCKKSPPDIHSTNNNTMKQNNGTPCNQIILDHNYAQIEDLHTKIVFSCPEDTAVSEQNGNLNCSIQTNTDQETDLSKETIIKGIPIIRSIETTNNHELSNKMRRYPKIKVDKNGISSENYANQKNNLLLRTIKKEKSFVNNDVIVNSLPAIIVHDDFEDKDDIEDENDEEKKFKVSESKMYEKFSFEKVLAGQNKTKFEEESEVIESEEKSPSQLIIKNSQENDFKYLKNENVNECTDSPEINFDELLNDISIENYQNSTNDFDTDWLQSLLETA